MRKEIRQKKQRSFFSSFAIVFGIIFLAVLCLGIVQEYAKRSELDREVAGLEQELEKLKFQKNNFLSSIETYQTEFFVEQEARTKFNLKKPGEKVSVIPTQGIGLVSSGNNQLAANGQDSFTVTESALQNALNWWDYFFKQT